MALLLAVAVSTRAVMFAGEGDSQGSIDANRKPPIGNVPLWKGLGEKASEEASLEVSQETQLRSLRLLRGRSERIPPTVGNQIRRSVGALPGEFDFEFTHWIPGTGGLWVIGGENLTCIAYNDGKQTACDTSIRAAKRGLALGVASVPRAGEPEEFVVAGLAPDWAEVARLRVGTATRRLSIEGNAYLVRAQKRIFLERLEP